MLGTLLYLATWVARVERWSPAPIAANTPLARFLATAAVAVAAYAALTPVLYHSTLLYTPGRLVTTAAARILTAAGGTHVSASGIVLTTPTGSFFVTPECVATPLMPLYLAAVLSLPRTWGRRLLGLVAFGPVFVALLVARLLTVSLPPVADASPLFITHGFHQWVLGALLVGVASARRPGAAGFVRPAARATMILAALVAVSWVAGRSYAVLVTAGSAVLSRVVPSVLVSLWAQGDLQGALLVLPVYQLALFLGLWTAWHGRRRFARAMVGVVALYASQVMLLVVLGALNVQSGADLPALFLRAWAVAAPLVLAAALARPPRTPRSLEGPGL